MNKIERCAKVFSAESLRDFFMGRIYPIVVALIVLVGYFTGLEFYLHLVNMALICAALLVCDSIRPLIMPLCSFVFQISMQNSPSDLNNGVPSNYYFEEGRLPVLVISFVAVFVALVYFFIKNKLISGRSLRSLPYLIPTAVLAVALMLGGIGSGEWTVDELGFALVQIVSWFLIFYLFVLGLKNENAKDITRYVVYISSLIAMILIAEVLEIYLTTENMMNGEGTIDRHLLRYGWGICNTAAQAVGVLVPVLFIGAIKGEKPLYRIYYFTIATFAFVASIMNASRTALLTGAPIYIACLVVYVIKSKHKIRNMIEILAVIAALVACLMPVRESIALLIDNYTLRGINDSGRYVIWEYAIKMFSENKIFGLGTIAHAKISPYTSTHAEFLPFMVHNTPIQLLVGYGVVGFGAYIFYRASTVIPFFRKPKLEKSMLGLALLSVLVGSLLDNFLFYIMPMFYFSVCLATVEKHVEEEKSAIVTASVADDSASPAECVDSVECSCGEELSDVQCSDDVQSEEDAEEVCTEEKNREKEEHVECVVDLVGEEIKAEENI